MLRLACLGLALNDRNVNTIQLKSLQSAVYILPSVCIIFLPLPSGVVCSLSPRCPLPSRVVRSLSPRCPLPSRVVRSLCPRCPLPSGVVRSVSPCFPLPGRVVRSVSPRCPLPGGVVIIQLDFSNCRILQLPWIFLSLLTV